MASFDPQDWWKPSSWFESPGRQRPEDLNREAVGRWAMALAFCLCFAGLAPRPLFPFAVAGFLFLAALASMAVAALQRHEPLAPHLTAWDEASWSLTLSLGLRLLLGPPPGG